MKTVFNAVCATFIFAFVLWCIASFSFLEFVPFYYGGSAGAQYGRMCVAIVFVALIIAGICSDDSVESNETKKGE